MTLAIRAALALMALAPTLAYAQLPIADLRVRYQVISEVPTLDQFFLWDPTITPQHPQVVRVRIVNNGPNEPTDVAVTVSTQGMTDTNVEITWPAHCDISRVPAPSIRLSWSIGLLRLGEFRECDLTFRARSTAPILPPLELLRPFGFTPTTAQTRPPPPSFVYGGPDGVFTVYPTTSTTVLENKALWRLLQVKWEVCHADGAGGAIRGVLCRDRRRAGSRGSCAARAVVPEGSDVAWRAEEH